jgi:hypothetical protein
VKLNPARERAFMDSSMVRYVKISAGAFRGDNGCHAVITTASPYMPQILEASKVPSERPELRLIVGQGCFPPSEGSWWVKVKRSYIEIGSWEV